MSEPTAPRDDEDTEGHGRMARVDAEPDQTDDVEGHGRWHPAP
jgi:hypothetical protein